MEKRGEIIRLKKSLYVVSDKISRKSVSRELVANHLYGASYISFETALAYYGMIPERVYTVRSMTTKRAKNFTTLLGNFEYKPFQQIISALDFGRRLLKTATRS
jgi:predicted transcriptional regulator of viral defense system